MASAIGRVAVSKKISQKDFVERLAERAETQKFTNSLFRISELLEENFEREKAADELGTSVLIEKSVPYAIFCFLKDKDSFEKALMNVIMVHGDRDTIGAMTGAISGAFLGIEAIPERWKLKLEDIDYIGSLAEKLFKIY